MKSHYLITSGIAILAVVGVVAVNNVNTTRLTQINSASAATGATYYVSSTGNDSNDGLSPTSAWKTTTPVNALTISPGTIISFEGGKTFTGGIFLDQNDRGSIESPITITSYGTGNATITPSTVADSNGLFAYNTAGIVIQNINFVGNATAKSGINFYSELPNNQILNYILIDNVKTSLFNDTGIIIGSWNNLSGFSNVTIKNSESFDNKKNGIVFYAQVPYVHTNVLVSNSKAYRNRGIPNIQQTSGSGIVLGGVNTGRVETSTAFENGDLCNHPSGPVGIFAYDSNNIVFSGNTSYKTKTGSWVDGDGFDFGQNTTNSIMENNTAYDNDGPGYLMDHSPTSGSNKGNTIRNNKSTNDGRKNGEFSIYLWGKVQDAKVYGNTVTAYPASVNTAGTIRVGNITIEDRYVSNVQIYSNKFISKKGVPLVKVDASELKGAQNLKFYSNTYTVDNNVFKVIWGSKTYTSLSSWKKATGQES